MRTRLSALLVVLIGVVLVSLGVPLITGIASGEARTLHTDRMADLSMFVSLVPSDPDAPAWRSWHWSAIYSATRICTASR